MKETANNAADKSEIAKVKGAAIDTDRQLLVTRSIHITTDAITQRL